MIPLLCIWFYEIRFKDRGCQGCVWHPCAVVAGTDSDWLEQERRWLRVPTCCQSPFLWSTSRPPPLVRRSGEHNPDQVSFVRARNVNGKCGAKTSDSSARHKSGAQLGLIRTKKDLRKKWPLICRSWTSVAVTWQKCWAGIVVRLGFIDTVNTIASSLNSSWPLWKSHKCLRLYKSWGFNELTYPT